MACQEPLDVTSDQLSASSSDGSFEAFNAILDENGSWVPTTSDRLQWLQIDLHRQILVSGVVIQGRPDIKEWVTSYQIEYALDGASWENVTDESSSTEVSLI